jgi:hypothetical protein
VQCFKINNGAADEVFIAKVDTSNNRLIPIKRGIAGTSRIVFTTGDTITLLKASYVFMDDDLATIDYTNVYPVWRASAPSSPTTGDYYFNISERKWYKYNGASWDALGRIYLGIAVCDHQYCLYVEHENFFYDWDGLLTFNSLKVMSATEVKINGPLAVNVAGNLIYIEDDVTLDITTDLDSGVSETASTWYYVYVSNTGEIKLSDVAPRRKDRRYGYYHPEKYWRAISVVFNDSSSDLLGLNHSNSSDKISLHVSSPAIGELSFTGSTTLTANLPPIIENVTLQVYLIYTDQNAPRFTLNEISEYRPSKAVSWYVLDEQVALSTPSTAQREVIKIIDIPFVRNASLGISNLGTGGTVYWMVAGLTIKF